MKHYGVIFAILLVLSCTCLPLTAQANPYSVETIVIDDFDVAGAVDFAWGIRASESIYENESTGEAYPKMVTVPGIPNPLKAYRKADAPEAMVLGIQTKFDRKGNNWFELYPQKQDENGELVPYEVSLQGNVAFFDFWVWGAKYMYYLDVLIRDADGAVHVLPAGNLAFAGWKNLVINIPTSIRQESRLNSGPKTLSFLGFRVRTDPNEYVDDFKIYFDQVRYNTHALDNIYDGYDLGSVDFDTAGGTY